ncbi:MAG: hypothetical protein PVH57_13845, partial [Syntrophobacterales bacterium]
MRYALKMMIVVSLVLAVTACVSDKNYNRAILRIEGTWKEVNDRTLESDGRRFFKATKQQGFMAAQLTASRLGMVVEEQSYETGYLFVTAPAPVPLTMAEWELVQKSDTEEMRSVVAKDIGMYSWWVTLDPSSKDVLANIFVIERGKDIEVSVGLRLRSKSAKSGKKRRLQPPPTAVRLGLSKFWATYEQELGSIVTKYSTSGSKRVASPSPRKSATVPKSAIAAPRLSGGNPYAIAVIIGNKNYRHRLPPVDFAHNDADAMKRFVVEILGISEGNIIYMRDVTLA